MVDMSAVTLASCCLQRICKQNGKLATEWKVGTQNGRLAHKVENWQHNGTLGITHPTHLLLRGSYAALSRGLNEALGQLKHKAKGEDMLGEDLCTVAF